MKSARKHDPLKLWLQRAALMYSFELGEDGISPMATPEQVRAELFERFAKLLQEMLPALRSDRPSLRPIPSSRNFTELKRGQRRDGRPISMNEYLKILTWLMALIAGYREHLIDCERELLVLVQMLHDPRIADMKASSKPGAQSNSAARMRRIQRGRAKKYNLPIKPPPVTAPPRPALTVADWKESQRREETDREPDPLI